MNHRFVIGDKVRVNSFSVNGAKVDFAQPFEAVVIRRHYAGEMWLYYLHGTGTTADGHTHHRWGNIPEQALSAIPD